MSVIPDTRAATPDQAEDPHRIPHGNVVASSVTPLLGGGVSTTNGAGVGAELSPAPILITEQEVVFSSSAAVLLPREKTTHRLIDATRVVGTALRSWFATSTATPPPARRHYPPRSSYLESARM